MQQSYNKNEKRIFRRRIGNNVGERVKTLVLSKEEQICFHILESFDTSFTSAPCYVMLSEGLCFKREDKDKNLYPEYTGSDSLQNADTERDHIAIVSEISGQVKNSTASESIKISGRQEKTGNSCSNYTEQPEFSSGEAEDEEESEGNPLEILLKLKEYIEQHNTGEETSFSEEDNNDMLDMPDITEVTELCFFLPDSTKDLARGKESAFVKQVSRQILEAVRENKLNLYSGKPFRLKQSSYNLHFSGMLLCSNIANAVHELSFLIEEKHVEFLYAVPLTEEEMNFAERYGINELMFRIWGCLPFVSEDRSSFLSRRNLSVPKRLASAIDNADITEKHLTEKLRQQDPLCAYNPSAAVLFWGLRRRFMSKVFCDLYEQDILEFYRNPYDYDLRSFIKNKLCGVLMIFDFSEEIRIFAEMYCRHTNEIDGPNFFRDMKLSAMDRLGADKFMDKDICPLSELYMPYDHEYISAALKLLQVNFAANSSYISSAEQEEDNSFISEQKQLALEKKFCCPVTVYESPVSRRFKLVAEMYYYTQSSLIDPVQSVLVIADKKWQLLPKIRIQLRDPTAEDLHNINSLFGTNLTIQDLKKLKMMFENFGNKEIQTLSANPAEEKAAETETKKTAALPRDSANRDLFKLVNEQYPQYDNCLLESIELNCGSSKGEKSPSYTEDKKRKNSGTDDPFSGYNAFTPVFGNNNLPEFSAFVSHESAAVRDLPAELMNRYKLQQQEADSEGNPECCFNVKFFTPKKLSGRLLESRKEQMERFPKLYLPLPDEYFITDRLITLRQKEVMLAGLDWKKDIIGHSSVTGYYDDKLRKQSLQAEEKDRTFFILHMPTLKPWDIWAVLNDGLWTRYADTMSLMSLHRRFAIKYRMHLISVSRTYAMFRIFNRLNYQEASEIILSMFCICPELRREGNLSQLADYLCKSKHIILNWDPDEITNK